MPTAYTEQELDIEWKHIYELRLAMLECYDHKSTTPTQIAIATQEADEVVRKLRDGK